jgi:hypothetical protein
MTVNISDHGKAVLSLCEEKEKLIAMAQIQNMYIESITKEFYDNVRQSSNRQKDILERLSEIDKYISEIAKVSTCGY